MTQQARKKDTGEAGNGGHFGTTRRGESEVSVPTLHPADDPDANPVLADIPVSTRASGEHYWRLNQEQALAYAESTGSEAQRLIASVGTQDFAVTQGGALESSRNFPGSDTRGTALYEINGSVCVEGDLGPDVSCIWITPGVSAEAELTLRPDPDNFETVDVSGVHLDDAPTTPEEFDSLMAYARSDEARELYHEELEALADPDAEAREAYYRGIGIAR